MKSLPWFLQPLCFLIFISILKVGKGQGCTNTCPPINFGKPVESLCEGDSASDFADTTSLYDVCYPVDGVTAFRLEDFRGEGKVTIIGNYYTGCNAGRRESGVFAHVAQRFYNQFGDRTTFIQSVKGGGTCTQWAGIYQNDAQQLYPNSDVVPTEMPLSVDDSDYIIRDDFFTTPFGHPSYVILDGELTVRHKFIGPCCGYENYYACTPDIAKELDTIMTQYIDDILLESSSNAPSMPPTESGASPTVESNDSESPSISPSSSGSPTISEGSCVVGEFSEWSACSLKCGTLMGKQFRWRTVSSYDDCPTPVEVRSCEPAEEICDEIEYGNCVPEFGENPTIQTVSTGFHSPRDVAFHPSPGLHLGNYSEGRTFHPDVGEEAWVLNSGNHSISIVAAMGTEHQTTISRRDRGYYHYMINGTALAFNTVNNSGRLEDRDGFNYWAICNDNLNTYLDTKEANYFMGPTLYNSDPNNFNTVNRRGDTCDKGEPCYFLHSDMLHEAPACIGIAHDPELVTSYGNVYWAFDTTGNRENGQLVRFDFQQPHGPGSMDHSVASVRRYIEVELQADEGVHAGLVVHDSRRELYIAVPGANKIVVVDADSGMYARSAREEYPIYSNRLPSFEYSIWECVSFADFALDIQTPSGLALKEDRLFVAERDTGKILVYEVTTGSLLYEIDTFLTQIGGLSFSPTTQVLHVVDEATDSLYSIQPTECTNPVQPRLNPEFQTVLEEAEQILGEDLFFLRRDFDCQVNPIIPNVTFFEQVHNDTGYASNITEGGNAMNPEAALLAYRTDCEYDSELNFDALLLGGYLCHVCLPEKELACDVGGTCTNVQWVGYTCDNEFAIKQNNEDYELLDMNGNSIDPDSLLLKPGTTYRFTVSDDIPICLSFDMYGSDSSRFRQNSELCASNGPLMLTYIDNSANQVVFHEDQGTILEITSCSNDRQFRFNDQSKKSCVWISNKEGRRKRFCNNHESVQNSCRMTCGYCCMDDPTFTFRGNKSCQWLSNRGTNQKNRICRKKLIKSYCPVTCDNCFDIP